MGRIKQCIQGLFPDNPDWALLGPVHRDPTKDLFTGPIQHHFKKVVSELNPQRSLYSKLGYSSHTNSCFITN